MSEIISNLITKQGSKTDVAQNFTIDDTIAKPIPSKKLRAVVASESIPRKVVDFLPRVMADIRFDVQVAGTSSDDAVDDSIWITDQIKSLIPWMTDAQITANIVGKAYLVFDRTTADYEDIDLNERVPLPKNETGASTADDDQNNHADENSDRLDRLNQLLDNTFNKAKQQRQEFSWDDSFKEKMPLAFSIDWELENITSIVGVQILPGDYYGWSEEGEYLVKEVGGRIGVDDGLEAYAGSRTKRTAANVEKWLNAKKVELIAGKRLDSQQYQAVHRSHVIELFAFDYQDDTIARNRSSISLDNKPATLISYRLSRFIPAFLRYSSFINATLNRLHRSEFLAYGKENLGELALDIARTLGEMNTSGTSVLNIGNQPDVSAVIQQEMQRILDSATNMGIVMYDKKHSLNVVSRTFTGLKDFNNIFRDSLISASGLTEFVLFGINSAGTGLASMDIRDRKYIADQSDSLWADHWLPPLLHLANLLSRSRDRIDIQTDVLKIALEKSFKLTDSEMAEWVQRVIDARTKLLEQRVLTPAMVLKELASDSMLGQHFSLIKDDVVAHVEALGLLSVDEIGSANKSGGLYPVKATEIKAESIKEVAEIGAESDVTNLETAAELGASDPTPTTTPINSTDKSADSIEIRLKDISDRAEVVQLWKDYTNMTDEEIGKWAAYVTSKQKNETIRKTCDRILYTRNKSVEQLTNDDVRFAQSEIRIIKNLISRFASSGLERESSSSRLNTFQIRLRNHAVKL